LATVFFQNKSFSDFRILTHFLFTLSIARTWRRVTTIALLTSLHLTYFLHLFGIHDIDA